MNYIFFGTPEFAAVILEKLIKNGFIPKAVVCNPDKLIGRKKILTPPPVKTGIMNYELGIRNKIKIFQPEKLNSSFKFQVLSFKPDFFIVAAYSKILPKEILEIPRLGAINVHPSLLPKWRGPSPIQSTILNGDEKTGVSIILMDEKIDHGPILAMREVEFPISNFQFSILSQKLAELGANLLIEILPKFLTGEIKPTPQDESKATYSKIIKTASGFVDLENLKESTKNGGWLAAEIERKIRALNPEPGVYTIINDKRLKILEAELIEGKLKIIKVQPEGKKPMNAADFFRGHLRILK